MTHATKSNTRFFNGSFFLLALMVVSLAMPAQANAGLLDWLFPRRAERVARRWSRATTAYRPVAATGVTGRNTSYFGGNFAGGQNFGSGGYYPSYGSWNGWGYQSNAGYYSTLRPTTVYRTQWSPVPVTTYSPTAGGAYQQPSTSYQWQALRVPFTSLQPASQTAATTTAFSGGSGSRCGGAFAQTAQPTTTQFSSGWQSVAPAAQSVAPAASIAPALPAATTAGFAPQADYSKATPWTPVETGASSTTGGSSTKGASEWQPVASEPRRTFEKQIAPADDRPGATPWRRVGEKVGDNEPTPASRAPRLEDSRSRRSSRDEEDLRMEYERERDAYARQRQELIRKERMLDEMIQRQRERASDDAGRRSRSSDLDRYSDWQSVQERGNRDDRAITRYDERYSDWKDRQSTAPRATYRPPSQAELASERDRERSEFYRRMSEENARRESERNAYRPMLDDGWSYDKADRRERTDVSADRYDWRSSSNDRPTYSTRTQAVPASMPNHRPSTDGSTTKSVMPLRLRPIPETNDNWNTQKGPRLLGPQDRTASLPTSDRWQAVPVDTSVAPVKPQWRSVRGR